MENKNYYNIKIDLTNYYYLLGNEFLVVINENEHRLNIQTGIPGKGSLYLNVPFGPFQFKIQSFKKSIFQKNTIQVLNLELIPDKNIWLKYSIDMACKSNLDFEYQQEPFIMPVEAKKDTTEPGKEIAENLNKNARTLGRVVGKSVWSIKKILGGK